MRLATLQLRDLRLLDPQLATSYPSAILARERALVVNLEYIKCIITQDCVLVLNPGASGVRSVGVVSADLLSSFEVI